MTAPHTATGTLLSVSRVILGDTLAADFAAGSTTITVTDPVDFNTERHPGFLVPGAGAYPGTAFFPGTDLYPGVGGTVEGSACGTVQIGGTLYVYLSCDESTGVITLAEPLAADAAADDRVNIWDPSVNDVAVEYRALVEVPGEVGNADVIDALLSLALVPLLPLGKRDEGAGETVIMQGRNGEWVVIDMPGKTPKIDGGLTTPGSIPVEALGFDLPNGTHVTVSPTEPTDPDDGDLWVFVDVSDPTQNTISEWDAGTSSWVPVQFGTGAIAAASITAELIAAGAIVAESIAAGALDAYAIAAVYLTATQMTGTVSDSTILTSDFRITVDGGRILVYQQTNPVVDLDTTTPGSGTYTVPGGVNLIKREAWGSGAAGASGGGLTGGAGGGQGGDYVCDPSYVVTPGQVIPYEVAAPGAGNIGSDGDDGNPSSIDSDLVAGGGKGGHGSRGGKGDTGDTLVPLGGIGFKGGAGANGTAGPTGGGGGSSAAPSTNGLNATDDTGAASAGTDSGQGGDAGSTGTAGTAPGGGGGASNGSHAGASGGAGRVRISYYADVVLVASIAADAGTDPLTGQAYPAGVMVYPSTTTDWNTAQTPGGWIGIAGSQSNAPDNSKTWVGQVHGRLETGTLVQVVHRLSTGDNVEMWERQYNAGTTTWQPWHKVTGAPDWTSTSDVGAYTGVACDVAIDASGKVRMRGHVTTGGTFNNASFDNVVDLPSSTYAPNSDVRKVIASGNGAIIGVLRIDSGSVHVQIQAEAGSSVATFYTDVDWDTK